jgi:hypothetical protein
MVVDFRNFDFTTLLDHASGLGDLLEEIDGALETLIQWFNDRKFAAIREKRGTLEAMIRGFVEQDAEHCALLEAVPAKLAQLEQKKERRSFDWVSLGGSYRLRKRTATRQIRKVIEQRDLAIALRKKNAQVVEGIKSKMRKLGHLAEHLKSFKNASIWAWLIQLIKSIAHAVGAFVAFQLDQFDNAAKHMLHSASGANKIGKMPIARDFA